MLAYFPSLFLPLLDDDYKIIWQAEHFGSLQGLPLLFHDPVERIRATVYWTVYPLWKVFHVSPWAFRVSSLLLHIADTWLVYAIGLAWARMRSAAFWAAGFFAVYEGHQEAVMWFSANNELLLFLFGGGSLLCWMKALCWLTAQARPGYLLRVAGILLFALALLTKESAIILLPLFVLVTPLPHWRNGWRKTIVPLLPYGALAAVAIVSIALTRDSSFRFSDGSFSIHAPVWLTLPRNFFRVLWVWGFFSGAIIFFTAAAAAVRRSGVIALAWIAIALIPYSFLTYSPQIPSRQLYLASVGLAFLFGLAMVRFREMTASRSWIAAVLLLIVVAHNTGYIWVKKQRQFRERAEPFEELIQVARDTPNRTDAPIYVRCFPRHRSIAEAAIYVALDRYPSNLVFNETELAGRKPGAVFCYDKR